MWRCGLCGRSRRQALPKAADSKRAPLHVTRATSGRATTLRTVDLDTERVLPDTVSSSRTGWRVVTADPGPRAWRAAPRPPGRHRGARSIDPGRPAPARAPVAPAQGWSGPGWPETSRSHPGCRVAVPERGRPAGSGSDIRGAPGAGIGRARARVDRAEGAPRGRAAPAERACRAGAGRPERAPPPRAERSARPARSGSPRAAPSGPRHGRGSAGRTSLVPDLAGQGRIPCANARYWMRARPLGRPARRSSGRAPHGRSTTGPCGRGSMRGPRTSAPQSRWPSRLGRRRPPTSLRVTTPRGAGRRRPTTASSRPGRPAWRGSTPSGPGGSTASSGGSEWNASPSSTGWSPSSW